MATSIAIWKSGQPGVAVSRCDPAWTTAIVCLRWIYERKSRLAGNYGKRLNTPFSTTSKYRNPLSWCFLQLISCSTLCLVVLTTIWCELVAEPHLFYLRRVPTRDRRLVGVAFSFLGGFVGRALVDQVGPRGHRSSCSRGSRLGIPKQTSKTVAFALFWLCQTPACQSFRELDFYALLCIYDWHVS
jgi:hypothetical protein